MQTIVVNFPATLYPRAGNVVLLQMLGLFDLIGVNLMTYTKLDCSRALTIKPALVVSQASTIPTQPVFDFDDPTRTVVSPVVWSQAESAGES